MTHDLRHVPVPKGDGYECSRCQIPIPMDAYLSMTLNDADTLVELAGMYVFRPGSKSDGREVVECHGGYAKAVTNQIVVRECPECRQGFINGEACSNCHASGVIAYKRTPNGEYELISMETELADIPGAEKKKAHKLSDIERSATLMAFESWKAMREATKPQETE